jgi:hypothetical protein
VARTLLRIPQTLVSFGIGTSAADQRLITYRNRAPQERINACMFWVIAGQRKSGKRSMRNGRNANPQNTLPSPPPSLITAGGQVVEWSMAPHSKCGVPARVPWVRIPPCPPIKEVLLPPFIGGLGAVDTPSFCWRAERALQKLVRRRSAAAVCRCKWRGLIPTCPFRHYCRIKPCLSGDRAVDYTVRDNTEHRCLP